ncbi:MAG: carboxymuconolactone decarboxylase family protein [Planctomycetota bacterium]
MDARPDLDALEARPGLAPAERCLCLAMAALTAYELDDFEALAARALARGATPAQLRELCLMGVPYAGFPAPSRRCSGSTAASTTAPAVASRRTPRAARRTSGRSTGDMRSGSWTGSRPSTRPSPTACSAWPTAPCSAGRTSRVAQGTLRGGLLVVLAQQEQCQAHAVGALRFGASEDQVLEAVRSVEACWPATRGRIDEDALRAFLSKVRGRGL